MLQFSADELDRLRRKAEKWPGVLQGLRKETEAVIELPLQVPDAGVGNWFMYYVCPDCCEKLTFDRLSPHSHRCPVCGKSYTGEPYDGSWWGIVNQENADAAWKLALLWLLTGERSYAEKAQKLLLAYAEKYPNYAVHGDIPYNGPGRANAQTLDEARFLRGLARGADLLDDFLSDGQKQILRKNLWRIGADFLRQNRHDQIHNHEVIVDSTIAALGLLLQDDDLVDFAVYRPYGIVWQLEHGVLPDGRWFEGCFGYQFFALESFVDFEIFARHTSCSQLKHPAYQAMLESAYDYLTPMMNFPLENDWHPNHHNRENLQLYEFFYQVSPTPAIATLLNLAYLDQPRTNLLAFLYGPEKLPDAESWQPRNHPGNQGSNVVLHGKNGRYLELKCGTFGGEHDHYDKLGLNYMAYAQPVSIDLGTCNYGAPLHYAYYKNTAAHNTVSLNGKNQPPCNGKLLRYEETSDGTAWVDACADWENPGPMPDSFTICQWDADTYRNAKMRRQIAWCDGYYVDVFTVYNRSKEPILWSQHFDGERTALPNETAITSPFTAGPLAYLHDFSTAASQPVTYQGHGVITKVFSFAPPGTQCLFAKGPNNPPTSDLCYQIEKLEAQQGTFVHLVESWQDSPMVRDVQYARHGNDIVLTVTQANGKKKKLSFSV